MSLGKKKAAKQVVEEMDLKKAAQLLQQNKHERELAFQKELQELCKKYGVNLSSQLVIQAI